MALEDTELKIGGVNLKGVWIAIVVSIATTMAGGIWAVAEFYGRIEKVESAVQALPDASDKLIELGANLDSIMKNQQQLLDLRDKVSDMETTMAESVLKVNQAAEKVQSIGRLQKEVEDLWRGMDALANPLQQEKTMEDNNIVDKSAYQKNRRYMAWACLGMMVISTVAVLAAPARFESAEAILMMMYGSLSAVVAAYFGFAKK